MIRSAIEYEAWLGTRNTLCSRGDPSKVSGLKHHSVLYDLPYFEVQIAIHIFCQSWTIVFTLQFQEKL